MFVARGPRAYAAAVALILTLVCTAAAKYGGGTGEPNDPYLIYTPEQMNAIGAEPSDWDKHFKLMADIDLGSYTGEQFHMIGTDLPRSLPFSGSFDGNGHRIHNLTYRSSGTGSVGLFGFIRTGFGGPAVIRNLGLVDPNVEAASARGVAALVGQIFNGTISDCYVEGGRVSGFAGVGGLVGYTSPTNMAMERKIVRCHTSCQVSGDSAVGGLAGSVLGMAGVLDCRSSGTVTGTEEVGGLVGGAEHAQISHCSSSARVVGKHKTGGLVGLCTGGPDAIATCAALGSVTGEEDTGGLVGWNVYSSIVNSYSVAPVSGLSRVGGLVGANQGTVTTCYAAGLVKGESQTGGLIGSPSADPFYPDGSVTDSFWDTDTSGQTTSAGGAGRTTAEMQTASTFLAAGWDFAGETANGSEDIWRIVEGQDYPHLWWERVGKYGGGTGEPNDPYLIFTAEHMRAIGAEPNDWDKHFKLMSDLDMIAYQGASKSETVRPIGVYSQRPFSGHFDGNGHTISHLTIRETGLGPAGLFGFVRPPLPSGFPWSNEAEAIEVIRDLGLVEPNVQSPSNIGVGALIGYLNYGQVSSCYVKRGIVKGANRAGGLVGSAPSHSMPTPHVLYNCYVEGCDVQGSSSVGGLVGEFGDGRIDACWSTARVRGYESVGGLAGMVEMFEEGDYLSMCWSSGTVEGDNETGGLVGACRGHGSITNCYSTAAVKGGPVTGGLVGANIYGTIADCYSGGTVTGESQTGGLIGVLTVDPCDPAGSVTDSFWDTDTSGQTTSAGGMGKTTAEMQILRTFLDAGWDFIGEKANGTEDIWWIEEGKDYPRLWWEAGDEASK